MPTWLWIVLAVVALVWASYLVARLRYSGAATIKPYPLRKGDTDAVLYIPGILSPAPRGCWESMTR